MRAALRVPLQHWKGHCRALWEACRQLAAATGGAATFTRSTVTSLQDLERSRGPLHGIVVAAGAAIGTIPETSAPPWPGCLLALCTTHCCNMAVHEALHLPLC